MGQIHLTFLHLQVIDYTILIIQHYPLPNTFFDVMAFKFCLLLHLPTFLGSIHSVGETWPGTLGVEERKI